MKVAHAIKGLLAMKPDRRIVLAFEEFDRRWSEEMKKQNVVSTCSKGCSSCCSEPVYASRAEARLALGCVGVDFLPSVMKKTHAWLATAQSSGILENPEPHVMDYLAVGLPCPLLENNLCLAYRLRPFGCRSHCATGPAEMCGSARLQQRYARSPELIAATGRKIFFNQHVEGDHLGVWLSRLLLNSPVRSAAHVSAAKVLHTV